MDRWISPRAEEKSLATRTVHPKDALVEVFIDGSCGPVNPGGTACYGYVIRKRWRVLFRGSGVVGTSRNMTNNVAEYHGLIGAIEKIKEVGLDGERIVVKSDSELLVHQMTGEWRVKAPLLKPLHRKAVALIRDLEISFTWIPREENAEADELARKAYREETEF
jgi:ribonuclease HI